MAQIGNVLAQRNVLRRWLDTGIICTKPNGKYADFGNVFLLVLLGKALYEVLKIPLETRLEMHRTCSKTGIAHSVLYPDNPRFKTSSLREYTSTVLHVSTWIGFAIITDEKASSRNHRPPRLPE